MAQSSTKRSSISSQLVLAFVSFGLLMIFGGVIALLQLNAMRQRAEYLYEADQPARAVLRVLSSFLSYHCPACKIRRVSRPRVTDCSRLSKPMSIMPFKRCAPCQPGRNATRN